MKVLEKSLDSYLKLLGRFGKYMHYKQEELLKIYGLPKIHGDWRPELKQNVDLCDLYVSYYIEPKDKFRVSQPLRKLKLEVNTKYFPQVYNVVESRFMALNNLTKENVNLLDVQVEKGDPMLNSILKELSVNVYLSEHRLRYQQEQHDRFFKSLKAFKRFSGNLDEFCYEYNKFLQNEISLSHNHLCPKIEDNYRRNYYQGDVSKVTPLIFYLYFKTDGLRKFMSKLLQSAHRTPQ